MPAPTAPACPACHGPLTRSGDTARCDACDRTFRVKSSTLNDKATLAPPPLPATSAITERVGRFEIRQRLGAGAFGAVYRAYDPQLDREVALKVPHPGSMDSPKRRERFLREAKAAANLRHPSIVPVFEAGQAGETLFIASGFVKGRPLADAIDDGGIDPRRAAEITRALAEATAYAHSEGIVHRDIKPANVLLDDHGRPHLLDFGLAARQDEEAKLTNDGAILGTPAYMAPEAAAGQQGEATPAVDQYSLGVTLSELLTGQTPFSGQVQLVLYNAIHTTPPTPSSLRPDVPRDLETVCLKAMAKRPEDRYADCTAFADDLRRWLDGESVSARPASVAERAVKWARRNPAVAGLIAAVAAVLVLGSVVSAAFGLVAMEQARRAEVARGEEARAKDAAEDRRKEADTARTAAIERERGERKAREEADAARAATQRELARADRLVYAGKLSLAQREWETGDPLAAFAHLDECRSDLRGWEHDYLWTMIHQHQATLRGHAAQVRAANFVPGGRVVSVAGDGEVRVWELATGLGRMLVKGGISTGLAAFSADGRSVLTGDGDKGLVVRDTENGTVLATLAGPGQPAYAAAFSPDGDRVVTAGPDRTARVWDVAAGRQLFTLPCRSGTSQVVGYSPDGKTIAVGAEDGLIVLRDATTGEERLTLRPAGDVLQGVAFSPNGQAIATGSLGGPVREWDVATGREKFNARVIGANAVAYAPDGRRLLVSANSTARMLDTTTGRELAVLKGHRGPIASACFSPDGRLVLTSSGDRTVKVWNPPPPPAVDSQVRRPSPLARSASLASDGRSLASVSADGVVSVQDADTGRQTGAFRGPGGLPNATSLSANGDRVAAGYSNGAICVWDVRASRELFAGQSNGKAVRAVTLSADGSRLLSGSEDQTARLWDVNTKRELLAFEGHARGVLCVAFSPDGSLVAAGAQDGSVRVWDARTGADRCVFHGPALPLHKVAFSPDGRRVVSAGADKSVKVWDAANGREQLNLAGHTKGVMAAQFSPDGQRIVTVSADSLVRIWDAATGVSLLTLGGEDRLVAAVGFSADGHRIVSVASNGVVRVYDASVGQEGRVLILPNLGQSVGFSPDNQRITVFCSGGWLKAWNVADSREVLADRESAPPPRGVPVAVSPDGQLRAEIEGESVVLTDVRRADRRVAIDRQRLAAWAKPDPAWHRAEADAAEKAKQHFAAAFHLQRLLDLKPDDTDALRKRLDAARKAIPVP